MDIERNTGAGRKEKQAESKFTVKEKSPSPRDKNRDKTSPHLRSGNSPQKMKDPASTKPIKMGGKNVLDESSPRNQAFASGKDLRCVERGIDLDPPSIQDTLLEDLGFAVFGLGVKAMTQNMVNGIALGVGIRVEIATIFSSEEILVNNSSSIAKAAKNVTSAVLEKTIETAAETPLKVGKEIFENLQIERRAASLSWSDFMKDCYPGVKR